MGCGAPAGAAVRAGSGPGPGPGLGDREMTALPAAPATRSVGRGAAGAPVSSCVVAGRSSVPDVAGGCGVRPAVGPGVRGCTVSEGRAAVVSVGVMVCACVGGPLGGVYAGSAAGGSGVPWCGRGSGWACVAAAWLAASVDRAPARRVVLGVAGFLWGLKTVPCACVRCRGVVRPGCQQPPYSWG